MWTQAKMKFKQLLFDDSGIAMAYTIVTFLVFFMICVSTLALSENIRRKMELQNACDSVAYSAAVVEADMLSRIAVLNRALSWTYVETNKRQMDETVFSWLTRTRDAYYKAEDSTRVFGALAVVDCKCDGRENIASNGSSCKDVKGGDMLYWMVGSVGQYSDGEFVPYYYSLPGANYYVGNDGHPKQIVLNRHQNVSINTIIAQIGNGRGKYGDYNSQAEAIQTGIKNMQILNREIAYCVQNIGSLIQQTVDYATQAHGFDAGTIVFKCIPGDFSQCFSSAVTEADLLGFSRNTAANAFSNGVDVWWKMVDGLPRGIGRNYVQNGGRLEASFCSVVCAHRDNPGEACQHGFSSGSWTRINGQVSVQAVAIPQILTSKYFGRNGTIVIAARSNEVGPLSFLGDSIGIYRPFSSSNSIIAVSAARAGIKLRSSQAGEYSIFYPGNTVQDTKNYTNGVWNLCEDDWDAVMLPLKYAWSDATASNSQFSQTTTNQLLKAVYQKFDPNVDLGDLDFDNAMWH